MDRCLCDILQHRHMRKQVEVLEHKTDFKPYIVERFVVGVYRLAVFIVSCHSDAAYLALTAVYLLKLIYTAQER